MGFGKFRVVYFACLLGISTAASAQTPAGHTCRPILAVNAVRMSEMSAPTFERKWSADVSVDASRCAKTSGRFEIGIIRAKENAPDEEFLVPFIWRIPSTQVSVDLWADEAVEGYWLNIRPCACSR